MTFFFSEKKGDPLMNKINLRQLGKTAKQWDHPVKGLLKWAEAMSKCGGNILKVPKKLRERYCISLISLALANDSGLEWWTHVPEQDPPDGVVMTLVEERGGLMGHAREIEVVEHRSQPSEVLDLIRTKMSEKSYDANTVLVCLMLSPAIYDLRYLSSQLANIPSKVEHVFVVFAGIAFSENPPRLNQIESTFSMVQLLPVFQQTTLDFSPYLTDFQKRYEKGQESRLIEGDQIFYGTANPKFKKS